ncbi:MAG: phosphatase PAP2 family protein [Pseudomonadota bacterium]
MAVRGITVGYLTLIAIALLAILLPVPDNNRGDSFLMIAVLIMPLLVAAYALRLLVMRHPEPTRQFIEDVQTHWPKLLGAVAVYLSLAIAIEVFSGLKKSIPFVMSFYLDPFFVDLDRTLFFGTDPWRITHAVFGWATQPIVWFYNMWHFVHIGLAVWVAFSLDEAQKIRFALLLQFIWLILGGGLAMLLSSVGPVMVGDFYGDRSFDPLLDTLESVAPSVLAVKDALISTMDDPLLISGISAMPSIHVAIAVAAALWMQRLKIKVLTWVGWGYVAIIYIGSIHLGWHYATDGMVSAPLVVLAWWSAGKYVDWLEGREFVIGKRPERSVKSS